MNLTNLSHLPTPAHQDPYLGPLGQHLYQISALHSKKKRTFISRVDLPLGKPKTRIFRGDFFCDLLRSREFWSHKCKCGIKRKYFLCCTKMVKHCHMKNFNLRVVNDQKRMPGINKMAAGRHLEFDKLVPCAHDCASGS